MTKIHITLDELTTLYKKPLFELLSEAHHKHCLYHKPGEIQICSLISIKTGGCPEDCKYCSQSARYKTSTQATPLMKTEEVVAEAKKAIDQGATRICLGAAWREVRDSTQFDEVVCMVKTIASMGVEVCCTLGMVKEAQAERLKQAGLFAYNHNLDTSASFYPTIITTRSYSDRLKTHKVIAQAQISLCCGGIFGMGESNQDRLALLHTLATLDPQPESVPLNRLSAIPATPLQDLPPFDIWEMMRMVALTRLALPKTMIRLSSGRKEMSFESQALCFFAGANSIFAGDKLLTISNHPVDLDKELFQLLGLKMRKAYTCARD